MEHSSSQPPASSPTSLWQRLLGRDNRLFWISSAAMLVVMAIWLTYTPNGLLGKADAIGYAVCHRITVRSFLFPDGRQLPMCARCSGTFLGVLVGLLAPGLIFRRRHAAAFPPLWIAGIMLLMSAAWAFDGSNSFLHLIPGSNRFWLYEPNNFLRLLTGTAHGITMGSLILPVVNATLWDDASSEPTVANGWHLLGMYALGALLMAGILSGLGVFLYPLGFLSAVGAATILAAINVVIAATVLRRENTAHTVVDALPLIFLGIALAFILVGAIDAMRYSVFHTWDGFVFPSAWLLAGLV